MLSYVLILALFVPALVSAQTQGIRECVGRPFINQMQIENCDRTPCDVFQGSNASMIVDFRALQSSVTLRPRVFATALGVTIEYTLPIEHQNACNHLTTGSCPLSANEDITYGFVFPITSVYPPIPVTVEITLHGDNDHHVFCAIADIHVRLR